MAHTRKRGSRGGRKKNRRLNRSVSRPKNRMTRIKATSPIVYQPISYVHMGGWADAHRIMSMHRTKGTNRNAENQSFRFGGPGFGLGFNPSTGRCTRLVRNGEMIRNSAPRSRVLHVELAGYDMPTRRGKHSRSSRSGRGLCLEADIISAQLGDAVALKRYQAWIQSSYVMKINVKCGTYMNDPINWSRGKSGGIMLDPRRKRNR